VAGPYLKNGLGEPEIICFLHDLRCTGDNVKKNPDLKSGKACKLEIIGKLMH